MLRIIPLWIKHAALITAVTATAVGLNLSVMALDPGPSEPAEIASTAAPAEPVTAVASFDAPPTTVVQVVVDVPVLVETAPANAPTTTAAPAEPGDSIRVAPPASPVAAPADDTSAPTTAPVSPLQPLEAELTSLTADKGPLLVVPATTVAPTQQPAPSALALDTSSSSTASSSTSSSSSTVEPAPASTVVIADTAYLTYPIEGVGEVVVALHGGAALEFWSANAHDGWGVEVKDDDADEIRVRFHAPDDDEADLDDVDFRMRIDDEGVLRAEIEGHDG